MDIRTQHLLECIKGRRTIRYFKEDKEVEEEKITKILDAGRWAPSAGNVQDWIFIVTKDKALKMLLAEACAGQYWMTKAPVLIAVCSDTKRLKLLFGERGLNFYSIVDNAMAVQNMLLTAYSLGLGNCIVAAFDEEKVRRILKLPEEIKPVALIPIGYTSEKPKIPKRKDLGFHVFFDRYGQRVKKPEKKIR